MTASGQSSSQLDVVIYDAFDNTPIILESGTGLFPIECVYGTVEVKTTLDARAIDDSARAIGVIRRFAAEKRYAGFEVRDDGNGNKVAVYGERLPENPPLPPRSFIFAVDSSYGTIQSVETKLKEATEQNGAHVHGLAVLNKNWLIGQQPFEKDHKFVRRETDSFALFCVTVLNTIQTIKIRPAAMAPYLGLSSE